MHVRCQGLPGPIQWQQPGGLQSFFFYAIIRTLRGSVMEETKKKYWEKEAIRISEMMHPSKKGGEVATRALNQMKAK